MGDETRPPGRLPCGIVCSNCQACIFRHYAATEGRCWNCRTALREGQTCENGSGI